MKNKKFYLFYGACVYFVTNHDGVVVCGPGFGRVLPEWGNRQLMNAYYQCEMVGTKNECIDELKKAYFFTAKNRDITKRRKKGVVGA